MNEEYKKRANAIKYEWIENGRGEVCLRPMLFDEEGKQIVRYYPDPCEFERWDKALTRLQEREWEYQA